MTKNIKDNQYLVEAERMANTLKTMNSENLDELKQLKNEVNQKLFEMTKQQLYNRIHRTLKVDQQAIKQKEEAKDAIRQMKVVLQTINRHLEVCHMNLQTKQLKKSATGNKLKGKA